MFVPGQNSLASLFIPFTVYKDFECPLRITFQNFRGCVLLFSYQGSCRFDSFDILSYRFVLVKNFFNFFVFRVCRSFATAYIGYHKPFGLSTLFLSFITNGEGGI